MRIYSRHTKLTHQLWVCSQGDAGSRGSGDEGSAANPPPGQRGAAQARRRQQRSTIKKQVAHRKMARTVMLYLAADIWRLKLGFSNTKSQGHADRIRGKPSRAHWGCSMALSVPVKLGRCSLQQADRLGKMFEFVPILGLRAWLINPRHEVPARQCERLHKAAHD